MRDAEQQQEIIDRVMVKHADSLHLMRPPRTPLEELMGKEDGRDGTEEMNETRLRVFRGILEFIFQDGAEPLKVLRFVFALAKAVRPELIADMSLADISIICADGGKATVSARIKRIYNGTLAKAGVQACAAPFQKRGNYAAGQKGNSNRKGTGKKAIQKKMDAGVKGKLLARMQARGKKAEN